MEWNGNSARCKTVFEGIYKNSYLKATGTDFEVLYTTNKASKSSGVPMAHRTASLLRRLKKQSNKTLTFCKEHLYDYVTPHEIQICRRDITPELLRSMEDQPARKHAKIYVHTFHTWVSFVSLVMKILHLLTY
jgi:hypothetical protein